MIHRRGAQRWTNVHVTEETALDDLIDIDNSATGSPQRTGFALLNQATRDLDGLVGEARKTCEGLGLGVGAHRHRSYRRLAFKHESAERLLRHFQQVFRVWLCTSEAPVCDSCTGRNVGGRAQHTPRTDGSSGLSPIT